MSIRIVVTISSLVSVGSVCAPSGVCEELGSTSAEPLSGDAQGGKSAVGEDDTDEKEPLLSWPNTLLVCDKGDDGVDWYVLFMGKEP